MKKNDIILGGVYSNGKGRIRKIVDEGSEYTNYDSQCDTDCVKFEVLSKNTFGTMTRQAFANWAKEKI